MVICVCKRVNDSAIRSAYQKGARRLRDLQTSLGVASCCGRCAECAQGVLRECAGDESSQGNR